MLEIVTTEEDKFCLLRTILLFLLLKNLSQFNLLLLNPKQKLAKHNRPVEEWLVQIEGLSVVVLYEENTIVDEIWLTRGESLRIPKNQYHQHTNHEDTECLTSWHFDGDITEVIQGLRALA